MPRIGIRFLLGALVSVCAIAAIGAAGRGPEAPGSLVAQGFDEQFSFHTLDPAWQVVEYTGARVYGYPLPANHFSLTVNPGYLRYILSPMTYHTGYLNNFLPMPANTYSCCAHDPGLELHRTFSGEEWLLESKVNYYMPYTNGRSLQSIIYFGNGGPGTVSVHFNRWRDVNGDTFLIYVDHKTGPSLLDYVRLTTFVYELPVYGGAEVMFYHRLHRAGNVLTATWSEDGVTWNPAFSLDMGTGLDGLGQRVVLTGLSWFNTGGSYADHDYVIVTPTADTTPPTIDSLSVSPNVLWPPLHQMVAVQVAVSASDLVTANPICVVSDVSSNESVNGLGDGDTAPDWTFPGGLEVNLRAERSGTGSGRIYTLTVACTDEAGNVATQPVTVTVPRSR